MEEKAKESLEKAPKQTWSINIVENKKGDGLTKIELSGNMGAKVIR